MQNHWDEFRERERERLLSKLKSHYVRTTVSRIMPLNKAYPAGVLIFSNELVKFVGTSHEPAALVGFRLKDWTGVERVDLDVSDVGKFVFCTKDRPFEGFISPFLTPMNTFMVRVQTHEAYTAPTIEVEVELLLQKTDAYPPDPIPIERVKHGEPVLVPLLKDEQLGKPYVHFVFCIGGVALPKRESAKAKYITVQCEDIQEAPFVELESILPSRRQPEAEDQPGAGPDVEDQPGAVGSDSSWCLLA